MRQSSLVLVSLSVVFTACNGLDIAPVVPETLAPAIEPTMVNVGDEVGPLASTTTGYSMEIGSFEDVMVAMELATPCADCLDSVEAMAEAVSNGSCPSISRMGQTYLEIEGGCVTEGGVVVEGRMVVHSTGAERVTAFENFAIRSDDGTFAANGSYRVAGSGIDSERSYNLVYTWEMGEDRDGQYAYDLDIVELGGVQTLSGEVETRLGSFAVNGTMAAVEGCAEEGVGAMSLIGRDEAELSIDGAKSCDACGELSLGGAEPEAVCR